MSRRGVDPSLHYLEWMYRRIGVRSDKNPSHSHFLLAEQLHKRLFLWSVPNDDNRIYDAIDMRLRYCEQFDVEPYLLGSDETCSVFEMLIAFTDRIVFETSDSDMDLGFGEWFWTLMGNLQLRHLTDEMYCAERGIYEQVETAMDIFIDRLYQPDGRGGLFPLQFPHQDQREVELRYQLSAYILERSDIGD